MEQNQTPNMQTAQALPEIHYAGFWIRFVAFLIDAIILGIASGILTTFLGNDMANFSGLIIGWLYFALMESSSKQATLGKMVLHLQVTDEMGKKLSFGRATGRYFAKIISTIILLIGYFMVGWTKKKQGLHDIIAKTLVIKHQ